MDLCSCKWWIRYAQGMGSSTTDYSAISGWLHICYQIGRSWTEKGPLAGFSNAGGYRLDWLLNSRIDFRGEVETIEKLGGTGVSFFHSKVLVDFCTPAILKNDFSSDEGHLHVAATCRIGDSRNGSRSRSHMSALQGDNSHVCQKPRTKNSVGS